jgi:hypothetical protein
VGCFNSVPANPCGISMLSLCAGGEFKHAQLDADNMDMQGMCVSVCVCVCVCLFVSLWVCVYLWMSGYVGIKV